MWELVDRESSESAAASKPNQVGCNCVRARWLAVLFWRRSGVPSSGGLAESGLGIAGFIDTIAEMDLCARCSDFDSPRDCDS
eukprot:1586108-Rhodomonas_salina.4